MTYHHSSCGGKDFAHWVIQLSGGSGTISSASAIRSSVEQDLTIWQEDLPLQGSAGYHSPGVGCKGPRDRVIEFGRGKGRPAEDAPCVQDFPIRQHGGRSVGPCCRHRSSEGKGPPAGSYSSAVVVLAPPVVSPAAI